MNFKEKKVHMMKYEKIPKLLINFGIPGIISLLINAIYNVVDTIFVSGLGTSAVGAASVAFPIYLLMAGFGLTFGTGAASNISRLMGENNPKQANEVASTAFFSSITVSFVIVTLGLIIMTPLLKSLGATDTILGYALDYSNTFIIAAGFIAVNITLNNMIRAEGSAKYSMFAILTGAVLNIILDPVFIYKFKLGIKGAAIATLISQLVTLAITLNYFYLGRSNLKLSLKNFSFSPKIMNGILKIGLPSLAAQILSSITIGLLNTSAAVYGDYAVAAMGIVNRFFSLGMFVIFGFSKGFQPIIGYNFGAKEYSRLNDAIKTSLKWTSYFCISTSILQIIFSKSIIRIFTNDPLVIDLGSKALILNSLTFILYGISIIYSALYLAMGDAKRGGVLSMAKGLLFLPLIVILPKFMGINGVISSQAIADVFLIVITIYLSFNLKNKLNFQPI